MGRLVRFSFALALAAMACAIPVSAAGASTLFGTTTIEGTGDFLTGTHSEAFRYESSIAGTATGVSIYLTSTSGVKVALYAESEGKPSARLERQQSQLPRQSRRLRSDQLRRQRLPKHLEHHLDLYGRADVRLRDRRRRSGRTGRRFPLSERLADSERGRRDQRHHEQPARL